MMRGNIALFEAHLSLESGIGSIRKTKRRGKKTSINHRTFQNGIRMIITCPVSFMSKAGGKKKHE
jgi:hypothetical protein